MNGDVKEEGMKRKEVRREERNKQEVLLLIHEYPKRRKVLCRTVIRY